MAKRFDLIGDVHGQADALERLLLRLGYVQTGTAFYHPERIAVFVGDFIDRGNQNRRVIEIVRSMVGKGYAYAVMGNHEYNAICYHTPDPDRPGQFLRPHTKKNYKQHAQTLKEFNRNPNGLNAMIEWFWTLPLYLDLSTIRIVHACWDENACSFLDETLGPNPRLTRPFLLASAREGTAEQDAIETVLKGCEFALPEDVSFRDGGDNLRKEARLRWWLHHADSLEDMVIGPPELYRSTVTYPADKNVLIGYDRSAPAVFFGHYWFHGTPKIQSANVACLDYSAGKGDKLVAYRWDGEPELKNSKFVWEAVSA